MASRALRLATAERRLAISDVARKLNKATQFCGSAIVNVLMGGRKKKLKVRVASTEAKARLQKAPSACDHEQEQQVRKPDGRRVDPDHAVSHESDNRDPGKGREQPQGTLSQDPTKPPAAILEERLSRERISTSSGVRTVANCSR